MVKSNSKALRYYFAFLGALALLAVVAYERYGSAANVVAVCQGRKVVLEKSNINLGETDGEIVKFVVNVKNLTSNKVILTGADFSCECAAISELPVTIEPFEEYALWIGLSLAGKEVGGFEQQFVVYVDCGSIVTLGGSVAGVILESQSGRK